METVVFFVFILAVGYLLFWTVVNEKRDPNGGYGGWFAIRAPKEKQEPRSNRQKPWLRNK